MQDLCSCPNTGALEIIPNSDCPFDLKQIQKIVFQKVGFVWDTASTTATSKDITKKADWDALKTATNDTKVITTPFIRDVKVTSGDFITEGGGDNTTLNGIEEITGVNPTKVTGMFKSITPEQEKALKKLMCHPLVAYFINQNGDIFGKKITDTKTSGFYLQALGVKDRSNEGFGTKDTNELQFSIPARWSENIVRISPADFNALTDL